MSINDLSHSLYSSLLLSWLEVVVVLGLGSLAGWYYVGKTWKE